MHIRVPHRGIQGCEPDKDMVLWFGLLTDRLPHGNTRVLGYGSLLDSIFNGRRRHPIGMDMGLSQDFHAYQIKH